MSGYFRLMLDEPQYPKSDLRPPNTSTAVMARRTVAYEKGLDYFPTPPHATEALLERIGVVSRLTCREPAAGGGHMVDVLERYFRDVDASDIKDYGRGYRIEDYLVSEPDHASVDWVITNPPFKHAEKFILKALEESRAGVAMFCRLSFLESKGRYARLFAQSPPSNIYVFSERVHVQAGRLARKSDPGSATAYAWFVWEKHRSSGYGTRMNWVPPGQPNRLL